MIIHAFFTVNRVVSNLEGLAELGFSPSKKKLAQSEPSIPDNDSVDSTSWIGQISMLDIVQNRSTALESKVVPFHVSLHSRAHPGCEMRLNVRVSIVRKCVHPVWGRVLGKIRKKGMLAKGNTQHLHMNTLFGAVEQNSDAFLDEISRHQFSHMHGVRSMFTDANSDATRSRVKHSIMKVQAAGKFARSGAGGGAVKHAKKGLSGTEAGCDSDVANFSRDGSPIFNESHDDGASNFKALHGALERDDDAAVRDMCSRIARNQNTLTQQLQMQIIQQQQLIKILLDRDRVGRKDAGGAESHDLQTNKSPEALGTLADRADVREQGSSGVNLEGTRASTLVIQKRAHEANGDGHTGNGNGLTNGTYFRNDGGVTGGTCAQEGESSVGEGGRPDTSPDPFSSFNSFSQILADH